MHCSEILADVLPALLRRNPRVVREGTVVQFIVADDKRCRWFFTWAGGDVVAQQGVTDRVDLTLSLVSEDLAGFLDHTLDFDHALATKRLKVMGDASLLLALAGAMRPA